MQILKFYITNEVTIRSCNKRLGFTQMSMINRLNFRNNRLLLTDTRDFLNKIRTG